MQEIFLISLGIVWLVFASIQDIKTREISNWLNFSLIVFALGFRFFFGIFSGESLNGFNFLYVVYSLSLTFLFFGIYFLLEKVFVVNYSKLNKLFKAQEGAGIFFMFVVAVFFAIWVFLDLRTGFFENIFLQGNLGFFYQGLLGLGIFLILGNLFYYGKVFAGGDAKLLIALGAVLPFSESFFINLEMFVLFLFLFLSTAIIYTLLVSSFIAAKNFRSFKKQFRKQFLKHKKIYNKVLIFSVVLIFLGIFASSLFAYIGILVFLFPYLHLYAKSVDESAMLKKVFPSQLTEGDWLYQAIKIKNKDIKPNWGGLSQEEISLIRKHYKGKNKKVKIRQGIPFSPVFLISFLVLVLILVV